jgi:hypothetical protein
LVLIYKLIASQQISRNNLLFPQFVFSFENASKLTNGFWCSSTTTMAEFIIPKPPKLGILRNQKTPINDRIGLATQYITDIATLQTCSLKSSRKGGMWKCTCLYDHFSGQQDSEALAKRVGTAVLEFCSFPKDRRSEYLMTVIKYSRIPFFGQGKKSRKFVLPERDFAANDANESDDDEDDNSLPLPICQSALMMVLGINSDAWRTVSKAADTNISSSQVITQWMKRRHCPS